MDYIIRKARHDDVPEIIEHLKVCSKLYKSKRSLMRNVDHITKFIHNLINSHFFVVASDVDSGRLYGFVSGLIVPYIYDPEVLAMTQTIWYVDPEFRRRKLSVELLDAYVEYGENNVDMVIASVQNYTPVSDKAFIRRGFEHKEVSYTMEVL